MATVGIDVGGTFTDLILYEPRGEQVTVHKTLTTPDDPTVGIVCGLGELLEHANLPVDGVTSIMHGTTIATNTVLEHKGASVGIITTEGYKDIIHIGRHQRPENYSIAQDIPWQFRPLVDRDLRFTVKGRLVPPAGDEVTPLDETAVEEACQQLREAGVTAVAVCYLFSYLNPAHEDRTKELLARHLPNVFLSVSHEVSPQFREFERFTTTALNAYVGPKMRHYIRHLGHAVQESGYRARLHVMKSNGGLSTADQVADQPVTTLLSGPAAGVIAGQWLGRQLDKNRLITFDVGGTSADIGIIGPEGIVEASARDTTIAGYPLMVPMIDIHTIGAGGGSIAYVDDAGALRVGPHSAGADPGPACYGRGGTQPTVTDAFLELGYLSPKHFLGGSMDLLADRAHQALADLARTLSMEVPQVAAGIITIVDNNMATAIQSRTVQKGHDPREFSLVAFGGAGGLCAVDVARILSIPEVLIPLYPGITSAIGLATTSLRYDLLRTEFMTPDTIDYAKLNRDFAELQDQLTQQFVSDAVDPGHLRFEWVADCRYSGQGYELKVPVPRGAVWDDDSTEQLYRAFHHQHELEYGHAFVQSPIEVVNIRVTGYGDAPVLVRLPYAGLLAASDSTVEYQDATFTVDGHRQTVSAPLIDRLKLAVGERVSGPAILLQPDSTTVLPPDCMAEVQPTGDLLVKV